MCLIIMAGVQYVYIIEYQFKTCLVILMRRAVETHGRVSLQIDYAYPCFFTKIPGNFH